jgi:arylsulfatase A-like enzyme
MYDAGWEGPHLIWPPYTAKGAEVLSPDQRRQLRASYGAKLTMIDAWFGRILDVFDAQDLWRDTALILCTDHGHYLGEKDVWGKPAVPIYEALGHTPLLIAWPGVEPAAVSGLTTNVDLFATVADVFGVDIRQPTHGLSLVPLIEGRAPSVRDWLLTGVWGREVHLVDGDRKYCRAPAADNFPLSMWSNRWSTMPVSTYPDLRLPLPDRRAFLDRMPGTEVPVIRQPFSAGDALPYWALGRFSGNHLWDLNEDPDEERDLVGTAAEKETADALRQALLSIDAPADQLERLGLS